MMPTALTRRTVLALPSVLAIGVKGAHAQTPENEVVLAGFGGTLEALFRNKIIPLFQDQTGIKLTYVVGTALSNYSKIVATRARSEIDVYWSNELTHVAGKSQGLYAALDPKVVVNLPDVVDVAKDPDGIGVGSYVIATVLQYNTEAYKEAGLPAPTSWNDLWDPRLKGRVALLSINVASSQDLLAILTRLQGGTEADISPGLKRVRALKDMGNLIAFAASPAEIDNMLVQKQAWITINSSPRPLILKQRGAPIDAVFPKEGAGFFMNFFDIVKSAPHPVAAQKLVNFLVSPEIQGLIAEGAVATPINRKVPLPASVKAAMEGQDVSKFIRIDRTIMNRDLDKWTEAWTREIESR